MRVNHGSWIEAKLPLPRFAIKSGILPELYFAAVREEEVAGA